MSTSSDLLFDEKLKQFGLEFEPEIRGGAHYEVAVENDGVMYLSGMIPRVGGVVVVTGRVGAETSLEQTRHAARVSVLRSLAVLRQTLGSLQRVRKILRLTVYMQCTPDFTQHSEVADAASDILYEIFAPSGGHTRTSVGVYQLPKNAAVELDLIVAIQPD